MIYLGYIKNLIFALSLLNIGYLQADSIRPYQTTRLISTSGAGVASMLVHESTLLNPAPVAFFDGTYLSSQRSRSSYNSSQNTKNEQESELHIVTDTSSVLKGSVSHFYNNDFGNTRRRSSLSMSGPVNKKTAMGLIYHFSQDRINDIESEYSRFDLGLIHVYSEEISLGAVLQDAAGATGDQRKFIGGLHYNLTNLISLILDYEIDINGDKEKDNANRFAIQLSATESIFLRGGMFNDFINYEKGTSYGLSWVGPKLSIDLGVKKLQVTKSSTEKNLYKDDEITQASIAMSLRI
jgi:hypothetical protein